MQDKYLLFIYDWFYPEGGYNDFVSTHESIEKCLEEIEKNIYGDLYCQIVKDNKIILKGVRDTDKYPAKWQFETVE